MSTPADQPAPGPARDPSVAARVEDLYESHESLVRSICRSLLRDRVEAEDAVQQTFLSAQRALLNGSSPLDDAAWLATIARNESLARVRARMREPLPSEIEGHAAVPDAYAATVRRHDAGELRAALAQLPRQQREAILLRELRGLSYQEVATALSVTTSAVESLLFRARRSLQTRLQEALASVSLAEWLQPLRELAARLGGGGLAAPAAAKVAAVGVGTAVVTGGALVGPTVLGLGHAPAVGRGASRPAVHRAAHAAESSPPVTFSLERTTTHLGQAAVAVHPLRDHGSGQDRSASDAREAERSTEPTAGTEAGDRSPASGSTSNAPDDNSAPQTTSQTTSDSSAGTTDDTSTNPSSDAATTPSTPDD